MILRLTKHVENLLDLTPERMAFRLKYKAIFLRP